MSFDNLSRPPSVRYRDSQIDDLDDDIPDFIPVDDKLIDQSIDERSSGIPSSMGTDIASPLFERCLVGDRDSGIKDEHHGSDATLFQHDEQPALVRSVDMTANLDLDDMSFGEGSLKNKGHDISDQRDHDEDRTDYGVESNQLDDKSPAARPILRDFDAEIPDILLSSGGVDETNTDAMSPMKSDMEDQWDVAEQSETPDKEDKFDVDPAGEQLSENLDPTEKLDKEGDASLTSPDGPNPQKSSVGETDDYEADESMQSTTSQDEEQGQDERKKLRNLDAELEGLISSEIPATQEESQTFSGNEADEDESRLEHERSPKREESHPGFMPSHIMRNSNLQRSTSEANAYSADDEDSVFDIGQRDRQPLGAEQGDSYTDDFEQFCREESLSEGDERKRNSQDSSQVSFWLQGENRSTDDKPQVDTKDIKEESDSGEMDTSDSHVKFESYTPDVLTPEHEDLADQARDVDLLEQFAKSLVDDVVATATSPAVSEDPVSPVDKVDSPQDETRISLDNEYESLQRDVEPDHDVSIKDADTFILSHQTDMNNKSQALMDATDESPGTTSEVPDYSQDTDQETKEDKPLSPTLNDQSITGKLDMGLSQPTADPESSDSTTLEKDDSVQSLGTDSDVTEKQCDSSSASRAMTDSGTSYDFSSAEDLKDGTSAPKNENIGEGYVKCTDEPADECALLADSSMDGPTLERPPFDKDHSRPSFGGLSMISSEGERRISFSDIESESEADVTLTEDQIESIDNPEMQDSVASSTALSSDASLVGGTYVLESGTFTELRGSSLQPTLSNDSSIPARSTSVSDDVFTDNSHERSCSPIDPSGSFETSEITDHDCAEVFEGSDAAEQKEYPINDISELPADQERPIKKLSEIEDNEQLIKCSTPDHSPVSSTGSIEPVSIPADMDPLSSIIDFGQGQMTQNKMEQENGFEKKTSTDEVETPHVEIQTPMSDDPASSLSKDTIDIRTPTSADSNRRSSIVRFSKDVNVTIQDDNGVILSDNIVEHLHDSENETPDEEESSCERMEETKADDSFDSSDQKTEILPESTSFEGTTDFRSELPLSDEESDALAASIVAQAIQDSVKLYRQELSLPSDVSQSGSNNSIYDNLTTEDSPDTEEGMEFIVNEDEFSLYQNRQLSAVEELSESEGSIGSAHDVKTGFVDSVLEFISPADSIEDNSTEIDVKPAAQTTDITESFDDNSQEDDVDISSVDSVNTVVHPDGSETIAEDRLNEFASMTSSITSDVPIGPDFGLASLSSLKSHDEAKQDPSTTPANSEVSTPNSDIGVIQKFPKLSEPDTVSVSSSLAEFEQMEKSVTKDSPRSSMYMEKVIERSDRESVSSSVLEFETIESEMIGNQPDAIPSPMHVPDEKTNSTNSLCEFETLEEDAESEEMKREAEKVIAEITAVMSGSTSDEIRIGPEDSLLVDLEGMGEINNGSAEKAQHSLAVDMSTHRSDVSPSFVGNENAYSESYVAETTGIRLSDELAAIATIEDRRDSAVSASHQTVTDTNEEDTSGGAEAIQSIIDEAAASFEQMRSEMTDSAIFSNLDSQIASTPVDESFVRPDKSKCVVMSEPPLPTINDETTVMTDSLTEPSSASVMAKSIDSLTELTSPPQMTESIDSLKDSPNAEMTTSIDSPRTDQLDAMQTSTDSLLTEQRPLDLMTKSVDSIGGDHQPSVMTKSLDSLSSEVIHHPYLQESPVNAMSDSIYQDMLSSTGSSPPEGGMICSTDSLGKEGMPTDSVAMDQSTDSLGTPVAAGPSFMNKSTDSLGTPTAANPAALTTSTDSLEATSTPNVMDNVGVVAEPMNSSTDSLEQSNADDQPTAANSGIADGSMSISFHQNYPTSLNPFAAVVGDPDSDNESRSTTSSRSSRSSRSTRNREPYESDYRYEPRQKVFTMADVEAEREAKKVRKDSRSESPSSSLGSQSGEGTC